ncbi:MAG: nucleotide sugar dehydrogenase [Candidatus Aureabacteria bacterium]|nr:nucleotide sugar dehydrogenase [Candidatus Auribacterota bacterium]
MELVESLKNHQDKIAVVGLGYVGLPLAIEFGKTVRTIGFDVNKKRVELLKNKTDFNREITSSEIDESRYLEFTSDAAKLKEAKFIIVAVPTPITKNKQPDLFCVESATRIVGENLSKGAIVVYESTVFPGVTEDICVPIIEQYSGCRCGQDFKIGYSPERINPGDKEHTVTGILKIVSGQDKETLETIADVYSLVIKAGVFKAESIKCAEAAKVIENTQRDLNIALFNELSIIFDKMNIDTKSVLEAAGTKWNFIRMTPGLVGGHCIGVDPYYLTFKAEEMGYHPQVILAGRRINDGMGKFIAEQTVKHLIFAEKTVKNAKVLVLGITFKENVCDIRNSRVIDVIHELKEYGLDVEIVDLLADQEEVRHEYGVELTQYHPESTYDAIILTVAHTEFKKMMTIPALKNHLFRNGKPGVLIDVKWLFNKEEVIKAGLIYWRL